ncbi:MBL fold metallo-hydrolase [Kitasatospora sp. NPDC051914]|uniref:MBL fold metallo-hydrolase n=1 Tax=Kitasatospora sp. NPDC051914 TaxID=3154945 RepID=UPI00341E41D0
MTAQYRTPLDVRWIHGSTSSKHNTDPDLQVHQVDEATYILRQNKAVHYEAPFLYLLFGTERAVLIDTGATADPAHLPLRRTVDELIERRSPGLPLLVLHSHGHGDHTAGDGQFAGRPDTELVPAGEALAWFGFRGEESRALDLGGRVLECLATPGHHAASVTYFDPRTGFLLTGDTVYPGRLYVGDWPAFTRTVDRLVEFAATREVTHVLGCHIEMTTEPGTDYPLGTTHQPDEPPLELSVADLHELQAACREIGDRPGRHPYKRFVVCKPE